MKCCRNEAGYLQKKLANGFSFLKHSTLHDLQKASKTEDEKGVVNKNGSSKTKYKIKHL